MTVLARLVVFAKQVLVAFRRDGFPTWDQPPAKDIATATASDLLVGALAQSDFTAKKGPPTPSPR